ncbi:MAG: VanZ family protein [Clostridia bacterium]|nr:VanZ family protein [Clostridia bacterium]
MIPISDMLIRSISGYIFILPALILYFLSLKKTEKRQNLLHCISVSVFCYYLLGILTVTGIGYTGSISFDPRITLIPLLGMISGPIDTILNIILFVPLGIFLPFLYRSFRPMKTVAFTGFLLSFSVETLQMFGWGKTDINDLITNTLGACFGYWLYYLLSKCLPYHVKNQFHAQNINDRLEVFFLASFTLIIMVTVQPWVIHSLLNIR